MTNVRYTRIKVYTKEEIIKNIENICKVNISDETVWLSSIEIIKVTEKQVKLKYDGFYEENVRFDNFGFISPVRTGYFLEHDLDEIIESYKRIEKERLERRLKSIQESIKQLESLHIFKNNPNTI